MKSDSPIVENVLDERRAGVLLHPTSLPGGDLGGDAVHFLDFMRDAGLSVWQTLPLGPPHADGSPYHCLSASAINPSLISLDALVERGWLAVAPKAPDPAARLSALVQAYDAMLRSGHAADKEAFDKFRSDGPWLHDYALYQALRDDNAARPWWDWAPALRDRETKALEEARRRLSSQIDVICFEQFIAVQQWNALRRAAADRGILLFGDMPIFVALDSADVWAHRDVFKLDANGRPTVVAGVPPDYFSATGQHWGNPLYDWDALRKRGFDWWIARMQTDMTRFDLVRVDHFRGFEACWEIPANEKTAVNGNWVKVPGSELFDALIARFGRLPVVAEDLGLITSGVRSLRDRYGMPGMAVLQFAFGGGAANPYLPHNLSRNLVVYTGTHDNDTTRSWFENLSAQDQLRVVDYFGYLHEPMPWPLIRAALMSVGDYAVIPMQDFLGLGRGMRMNTPGTNKGNWAWRFNWSDIAPDLASGIRRLVVLYGRDGASDKSEG
jgi:4-alpha-glucanotransferase